MIITENLENIDKYKEEKKNYLQSHYPEITLLIFFVFPFNLCLCYLYVWVYICVCVCA